MTFDAFELFVAIVAGGTLGSAAWLLNWLCRLYLWRSWQVRLLDSRRACDAGETLTVIR